MAIRIRANGDVVCAAENPPMDGDFYIDDGQHYALSKHYAANWSPTEPWGKPDNPKPCWQHPQGDPECIRCGREGLNLHAGT